MKHNLLYFYNKNFDIGPVGAIIQKFSSRDTCLQSSVDTFIKILDIKFINAVSGKVGGLFLAGRHDTLIRS